jgi:ubiquinone/menaquinone biosynthesis C-methylase UbiE
MGDKSFKAMMQLKSDNLLHRAARRMLPSDRTFWKVYSPVIRVLRDSKEHQKIREKLSLGLDLRVDDILLDAGCGRGDWLIESSLKVKRAFGVDFEMGMLGAACRAGKTRTALAQASIEALPFADKTFNKIGSILVYGYISDRESAMKELVRVLSPGGKIGIVTPIKGASFFKVLKAEARNRKEEGSILSNLKRLPLALTAVFFGKLAELKDKFGDWHFYTYDELASELLAEGLIVHHGQKVYADQALLVIAEKPKS